jgi:hypothetical protein
MPSAGKDGHKKREEPQRTLQAGAIRIHYQSFFSSRVLSRLFVATTLLPSTFLVRHASVTEAVGGTVWLTASPSQPLCRVQWKVVAGLEARPTRNE